MLDETLKNSLEIRHKIVYNNKIKQGLRRNDDGCE